jgi:glycosyltransferase involved in cell wall biosynthesis
MKNVLLIGQFTDISGYGNAVRSYFRNLKNLHNSDKIELKILNYSFEAKSDISQEEKDEISKFSLIEDLSILGGRYKDYNNIIEEYLEKDYKLILFLTNDHLVSGKGSDKLFFNSGFLNLNLLVRKSLKTFPCVVWETDRPPKLWLEAYKEEKVDHLICACTWNSEIFNQYSGIDSTVVPYCLKDTESIDQEILNKINRVTNNNFTFCSVGQWSDRKGFDLLLRAFYTEFYSQEVFLIMKTYASRAIAGKNEKASLNNEILKIKNSINHYGNNFDPKCKIILLTDLMDKDKINSIYIASDCYVTATRGEGFGLPIAEFINMTNKPVVAPDKGGHIDFIHSDNYFVNCNSEPVRGLNSLYSEVEMNYYETSVKDLRKKMRLAFENKTKKTQNRAFLLEYLSDSSIEDKFMDILK